jgi:hypothetical protein
MADQLFDIGLFDDPRYAEPLAAPPVKPAIELDDEGRKRRAKTLATLSPLVLLEANKTYRNLEPYDLQELALAAIELIAVGMTLEGGASLEDVTDTLVPVATAQRPDGGEDEHRRAVSAVLETLIEPFRASYADYGRDEYVRRRFDVVLVREVEGAEGIHLRATIEAINAIVGALDTDIESAQHAAEEALRYALEKGRLDAAVQAARQASLRSIQYGEQVRALLAATRRNVAAVDWQEAAPRVIEEALAHLAARLDTERTIARSVAEQRDEVGEPGTVDLEKIAALHALLEACISRHALLRNKLLDAHQVFLDEQERQSFAPAGAVQLFDTERELLRPLLEAPYGETVAPLERFFAHAAGMKSRPLPRLASFLPGLLRAPTERAELGDALAETEFAIDAEPERFPPELWARSEALLQSLDEPTRLGDVLARARRESEELARLLRLRCLHAFGPEFGHPGELARPLLLADVDGDPLEDARYGGDDLVVFWVSSTDPATDEEGAPRMEVVQ